MTEFRFRVGGLTYLDKLELQEQMTKKLEGDAREAGDAAIVDFEEEPVPEGSFGEPVTLAVIVGGIALKGLIAYLVLRNPPDRFKERIEVEYPDGRRAVHTVELVIQKDRPVSDQVVKALSSVADIPISQLEG